MKYVIKQSDATQISEHGISTFTEYSLPAKTVAMGISEIKGRYPQTGVDVDTQIEQVWFVISGQGSIQIDGQRFELTSGDMVYIPANKPYVIDGSLKLVVASSPPWTSGQHKHLEQDA